MSHITDIRLEMGDINDNVFQAWGCVKHMFKGMLGRRLKTIDIHTISVYLTRRREEHLQYYHTGGFLTLDYFRESRPTQNEFESKKVILDMICEILLHIAGREHWDTDVILDAYNACLERDINAVWWFKGKVIAAPNRKHRIGVQHIYGVRRFESYLVLCDKKGNEIIRHLIFREGFPMFSVNRLSWRDNETIVYGFSGPKKEFVYTIDDLLNSRVAEVPEKVHMMFK